MSNTQKNSQISMDIDVKIYRANKAGPVLADASVTLGGCFAVRGITVRDGKNGPFVSMPCRQVWGEFRDIWFPCTREFKQTFDQAVLNAYHMELRQAEQKERTAPKMGGMSEMK